MGRGGTLPLALAAISLWLAPGAQAATEVGSTCEANSMLVGSTILPLTTSPSNGLPISVPAAGVATKWVVRSTPSPDVHTERLKVFRPTSSANQFQVVAESELRNVTGGRNSFDIRIPVQPGDRFGVSGKIGEGALACSPPRPGDVGGVLIGESPTGSTATFSEDATAQAAVSAVIEPDGDGDGYGDETQDQCRRSIFTHGPCPTLTLDAFPIVKKHSVVLFVTASSQAQVFISARVARPAPKRPYRPGASCCPPVFVGTVTVSPGSLAQLRLVFYRGLRSMLRSLSPKKSKKLIIDISAPADNEGRESTRKTVEVKLQGQASGHKRKGRPGGRTPRSPYRTGIGSTS